MVVGFTRLPSPALCQNHVVVGLVEIPGIVAVAPCTAADEAVANAVVHLAGKAVGITSVVGIAVAVVMRVTVDDVVIAAVAAVVLADARMGVAKLMAEAQLYARVQVIRELATLNAVVVSFQLDTVVSSMHDVYAEDDVIVA